MSSPDLPSDSDHLLVVGKNGTGKTVAALYLTALRYQPGKRLVLVDTKGDDHIKEIRRLRGVEEIDIRNPVPRHPGIYIVDHDPRKNDELEDFLWDIHRQGKISTVFDEGANVPAQSTAFITLLRTGRSLKNNVTVLSQRPVKIPVEARSETNYKMIFRLLTKGDRDSVAEYVSGGVEEVMSLPPYWSLFYNERYDAPKVWKPVPDMDVTLDILERKVKTGRRNIL